MMHFTQRKAEHDGRQAYADGKPLHGGNPYSRSTKSFVSFQRGWFAAERRATAASDRS